MIGGLRTLFGPLGHHSSNRSDVVVVHIALPTDQDEEVVVLPAVVAVARAQILVEACTGLVSECNVSSARSSAPPP